MERREGSGFGAQIAGLQTSSHDTRGTQQVLNKRDLSYYPSLSFSELWSHWQLCDGRAHPLPAQRPPGTASLTRLQAQEPRVHAELSLQGTGLTRG